MSLEYKKATIADIDLLVETRIEVLRAANKLDADTDMSIVERESRAYYQKALADESHTAYLIMDGTQIVGTGGISYYTVMPTYHNPTGKEGYIMNIYTCPEYRRQGIATKTLDFLIVDAHDRGIYSISLEATEMGRPLYEKYGFVDRKNEMEILL